MMRELDGLSYEEIAQQMNTPIGTVRSRIFRAREAMDAVLRRHLHGDLAPRDRESGNRKREQLP
jgi:RNA polymerase sigma-70 factor (ECF subfamily)